MDPALAAELSAHGLSQFLQGLSSLGVENPADVAHLRDTDLKQCGGMTLVQIRKLQSLALMMTRAAGPAQDAAQATEDSDTDAADHRQPSQARANSAIADWALSADGKFFQGVQLARRSNFWFGQLVGRPLRLIFVRHGESEGNLDRSITATVPDHMLHLTATGRQQALDAGQRLRSILGTESVKFTVSPYVRTRETLNGILQAWPGESPAVREDVRIREQEYGNFDSPDMRALHVEKRKFGPFFYRFPEGESIADCHDRASLFVESLYRSWDDNQTMNQVIVCHGMMILVTLMRLLRLPIDEFSRLDALRNCELVVLQRPPADPKFEIAYTWAPGEERDASGLRRAREPAGVELPVWDGDPAAPLLTNSPAA